MFHFLLEILVLVRTALTTNAIEVLFGRKIQRHGRFWKIAKLLRLWDLLRGVIPISPVLYNILFHSSERVLIGLTSLINTSQEEGSFRTNRWYPTHLVRELTICHKITIYIKNQRLFAPIKNNTCRIYIKRKNSCINIQSYKVSFIQACYVYWNKL